MELASPCGGRGVVGVVGAIGSGSAAVDGEPFVAGVTAGGDAPEDGRGDGRNADRGAGDGVGGGETAGVPWSEVFCEGVSN